MNYSSTQLRYGGWCETAVGKFADRVNFKFFQMYVQLIDAVWVPSWWMSVRPYLHTHELHAAFMYNTVS